MGLFSFLRKNKQAAAGRDSGYYSADEQAALRARGKRASPAGAAAARKEAADPNLPEKKRARRRLVGAIALALAVAVGLPMLLDSEPKPLASDIAIMIPSKDKPAAPAEPAGTEAAPSKAPAAALDQAEEEVALPPPAKALPKALAPTPAAALVEAPRRVEPAPKPEPKPEPRPAAEVWREIRPVEPKPAEPKLVEPKHEAKPVEPKREAKPAEAKRELKPVEVKHEPKPVPEVKHEPKPVPEVKHEPKPVSEVKHEPKPLPEPKHEPKPAPEPKHEPKPVEAKPAEPRHDKPAVKPAGDTQRALAILEGKAAAAEPAPAPARYLIQVAALANQDKVDELQARLRDAGIKYYSQKVPTQSGERTRIRLGPFGSKEEADKMRARLGRMGLGGALVPQ